MRTENNNEKGAAAVEFAMILPLLLIILFVIMEFSIILYDKAVITNASREGARAGIVMGTPRPTQGAIISAVDDYWAHNLISFGTSTAGPTTTVTVIATPGGPAASGGCASSGQILNVNVSYVYTFLAVPNLMGVIGGGGMSGGLTLTGHSAMRCE